MAGPAIRTLELARHLAAHHAVEVASLQPGERPDSALPIHTGVTGSELIALASRFDVLMAGGFVFAQHPDLLRLDRFRVLDLYDPILLEDLSEHGGKSVNTLRWTEHRRWLDSQLLVADFMVAASDRQRDYWLGRLCALGRLSPDLYALSPDARRLIEVVPFGLPGSSPRAGTPRLKGVVPGIGPGDIVLLWGGGLWDWLDPLTPIQAMAVAAERHPRLRMVFLGGRSPNPGTPTTPMAARARDLASHLGLLGRSVHFVDDWIPYEERGSLLIEADVGISAHPDSLETRFSFRTRILDYLWAGLPILTTSGDSMGDLVAARSLGVAVPPGDVAQWADALGRMANDPVWRAACAARSHEAAQEYRWERAIAPLVEYGKAPYNTPKAARAASWAKNPTLSLAAKTALSLRDEGLTGLKDRVGRFVARRTMRRGTHG